jgi:hypothetical protein
MQQTRAGASVVQTVSRAQETAMAPIRSVLPRPVPVQHLPPSSPAEPVLRHGSPPAQRALPLRRAA